MSDLVDNLLAEGDPEDPDFEAEVLERFRTLARKIDELEFLAGGSLRDQVEALGELRATQLRHGEMLQKLLGPTS